MLKSLHLKNWRSIRETTIEFTPITVLIGANASGKTNVLDALYFLRDVAKQDIAQAIYQTDYRGKIQPLGATDKEATCIEWICAFDDGEHLKEKIELNFSSGMSFPLSFPFSFSSGVDSVNHIVYIDDVSVQDLESDIGKQALRRLADFTIMHWQLLGENFMPPLVTALSNSRDLLVIESDAKNTVFMLDFMKQLRPELYEMLQEDLRFLLSFVDHISSKRKESEVQIAFHETKYPNREAPTVSAGTARILAILAAIYALDMRNPEMPGLVVIEEPETSLNPSLLRKFVELLRGYTEDAEKPRQFILTTHNPSFLNHFEPEEVRVVSRDDDGNTVVNLVPDYIREIWLDEHGLGDAWLTNAFGGVTE